MDAEDAKDLERYIRDKRRAEAKNKLSEVAQLCNCIGELYSKYARFEDAIQEHTQERHLSEALGDRIGEAVACRKIGEAHCALGQYKEALELQKKHLTLASECQNHLEEQRAWATIGRTYLCQSETRNIEESAMASKKAEKAFVKALEACENVKTSVKATEYMAMKGRLYLNIGLVYDGRGDVKQSADVIRRAVTIAEKFKLDSELYMCHASLANMYQKGNHYSQSLRSLEVCIKLAEKLRNKVGEREMYVQKAMVYVSIGDFLSAKHCLKKAHKLKIDSDISEKKLEVMFRCVNKIQEATQDLENTEDDKKMAKLFEVIADNEAELGNYTEAIEHYLKVLHYCHILSSDERAAIYVSLAQTYADIRQYDNAIFYYNKELEERKDNAEQSCRTLLNIAELEELKGSRYSTVCKVYMAAFEASRKAKLPKLQVQTLKSLVILQKLFNQTTHLQETERKLEAVRKKHKIPDKTDSQEEDNSSEGNDGTDEEGEKEDKMNGNISLSDLTVSGESEDNDDVLMANNISKKKSKLARRNEKGETPLHRACIDGNLKKVKSLIAEGHPVNPRDYCGWLPIHESCNHGHIAVVEHLLDSGAWMNDRGGERCGGVTPLIDAANCGNLDVVRLLIQRGANVLAKDDDGNTALDSLQGWYNRTGEVLGASDNLEFKTTEKLLQAKMGCGQSSTIQSWSRNATSSKRISAAKKSLSLAQTNKGLRNLDSSDEEESIAQSVAKKGTVNTFRGRLNKLRRKQESRTLNQSREKVKSSDEELSDSENIYHQHLSPSIDNTENPNHAAQVYRSTINSIGSSAQRRLEPDNFSNDLDEEEKDKTLGRPALLYEDEDVGDDWLINDMQIPKAKKTSAEVKTILTTSSSRSVSNVNRKRSRTDEKTSRLSSRFLELTGKRTKRSAADVHERDKKTGSNYKPNMRAINDDFDESSNDACPVTSSTGASCVPKPILKSTTPIRENEIWDSDDEMLCQIDTPYEEVNTYHNFNKANDSLDANTQNQSIVYPSPVLHSKQNTTMPFSEKDIEFNGPEASRLSKNDYNDNSDNSHHTFLNRKTTDLFKKIAQALDYSDTEKSVPSPTPIEKSTYKNSMRVKVRFGEQTLLIPIQIADQEKSISWLCQQARERYFNMFLVRPSLTISSQDGTMLCPSDSINTVLQDNEIVTANVSAWERPKLEERYTQACQLCLETPNKNVSVVLQQCDQSGQLQLCEMMLGFSLLQPVFKALEGQKTLTVLKLSGNRLGDSGITPLMNVVVDLPVLKILTLDTNGLSADGISVIASTLKSKACLQSLNTLSLSHNCLGDIVSGPLTTVLSCLPELRHLSLTSCSFSAKIFTSTFCEALRGCRLEKVQVAENQIGDDGIKSLLLSLHPDCLHSLDISHTRSTPRENITDCLHDFISGNQSYLRELSLAGCHLSEQDVAYINRLPLTAKFLNSLSLSQNHLVNNKTLQKLLCLSTGGGANLEQLTVRGCSITAPLGSEFMDSLQGKMSSSVPLKKFVFSCRGVQSSEISLINKIWTDRWEEHGKIKTVGMAISLTVV